MGVLDIVKTIGGNLADIGRSASPQRAVYSKRLPQPKERGAQELIDKTLKEERIQQRKEFTKPITRYLETGGGLIKRGMEGKRGQRRTRYTIAGGISYPGRPRLSFKPRTDPLTGRLIRVPANVYYKRQRLARRLGSATYQRAQMQKAQAYQRRGISPQQAAQIEAMRQQRMTQQMAMQQARMPSQMAQVQRFPVQQQFTQQYPQPQSMTTDFFRGGTQFRPKEAWLR